MCNNQLMMGATAVVGAIATAYSGPVGAEATGEALAAESGAGMATAYGTSAAYTSAMEAYTAAAAADASAGMSAAYGTTAAAGSATNYGMYMNLAGGLMSSAAQYEQGQTMGKIADYNAKVASGRATSALKAGAAAQDIAFNRQKAVAGAQRAAMGASGAQVDSGTFGNVLSQTAQMGSLDTQTTWYNALTTAYGLNNEVNQDNLQGSLARKGGLLNGAGSLLTTGARTYSMGTMGGQNPFQGFGW